LVTSPVEKAYDYLIPEGMELGLGDYVTVPLGPRAVHGVVWSVGGEGDVASSKMKSANSCNLPIAYIAPTTEPMEHPDME
jgi:primosomal protein N' (replication factor Y)